MPVPDQQRVTPRQTLRANAYEALKEKILDGTLEPGERLDDERLQQWLGVSRTPIREALVILDAEGLVNTRAQRSTCVATPDPKQALDEVRAVGALMSGVIRQTIPDLNAAEAKVLGECVDAIGAAAQQHDAKRAISAISHFHEAVLAACPNAPLARAVAQSLVLLSFDLKVTTTEASFQWGALQESCTALRTAIEQHDEITAERIVASMHYVPTSTPPDGEGNSH